MYPHFIPLILDLSVLAIRLATLPRLSPSYMLSVTSNSPLNGCWLMRDIWTDGCKHTKQFIHIHNNVITQYQSSQKTVWKQVGFAKYNFFLTHLLRLIITILNLHTVKCRNRTIYSFSSVYFICDYYYLAKTLKKNKFHIFCLNCTYIHETTFTQYPILPPRVDSRLHACVRVQCNLSKQIVCHFRGCFPQHRRLFSYTSLPNCSRPPIHSLCLPLFENVYIVFS